MASSNFLEHGLKDFIVPCSRMDHTLFVKHQKGNVIALVVYVDDIVVIGNE